MKKWKCKKCKSTDIKIVEEIGGRYSAHIDKSGKGIYETQKEDGTSDYYKFIGYYCYDCENNTLKNDIKEIAKWEEE